MSYSNESLSKLLTDWFKIHNKSEKGPLLSSKSTLIKLNHSQKVLFQKNKFRFNDTMSMNYIISYKYNTYNSTEYKITNKTCSYIIEYKDVDSLKYGTIHYYLSDKNIFAVISKINL